MTQKKIIEKLHLVFSELEKTLLLFPEAHFFKRPSEGKWSAAENAEHLFLCVKPLVGLFGKHESMLERWGSCNRKSRDYDAIVAAYLEKVGTVGKGLPNFTPENITASKQELIDNLNAINKTFLVISSLFTEKELDMYQVPHPVIGMLTCREFLYFTHYHTGRHCDTMKKLLVGFGGV